MNSSSDEEVVVKATRGWSAINLGKRWKHRELLYHLAWRDTKLRYKL